MSIHDRLVDADILWTAGRREGALFSTLVAVTAIARREHPGLGDGEAFRTFLADRHSWSIKIEHRGQLVTIEQLMWKWLRCELAHRAALPVDVQFYDVDDDPDDLRIQAGGPPEYCVRISDGWYWWLRRLIQDWLSEALPCIRILRLVIEPGGQQSRDKRVDALGNAAGVLDDGDEFFRLLPGHVERGHRLIDRVGGAAHLTAKVEQFLQYRRGLGVSCGRWYARRVSHVGRQCHARGGGVRGGSVTLIAGQGDAQVVRAWDAQAGPSVPGDGNWWRRLGRLTHQRRPSRWRRRSPA
jgi:hypothetical protein